MEDSVTASGPCVDTAEVFRSETRSILTAHVQLVNLKVMRMDVVDLGRNVDHMFNMEWRSQQCAGHLKL